MHCGDSRLYVVRDGELLTRTRDHSYLEQQNAGVIRMDRINRNILFTCLGSPTKPVFDVTGPVQLQQGDKILLCSDGLWGSLDDDDIVRDLSSQAGGRGRARPGRSARCATAASTRDNVTVIALEWETPDAFESTRGISTDSISDGVFASTIQAGVLGHAGRRPRRRRHRALHRRDQRGHPALGGPQGLSRPDVAAAAASVLRQSP